MLPTYVTRAVIASSDQLKNDSPRFEALAFMAAILRLKPTGSLCGRSQAIREFAHTARPWSARAGVKSSEPLQPTVGASWRPSSAKELRPINGGYFLRGYGVPSRCR